MKHKIFSLISISTFFLLFCCSQSNKSNNENTYLVAQVQKKIEISFMVDETVIQLQDDFNVYIVNGAKIAKCSSVNNYIQLPKLDEDVSYIIKFKYKSYCISFDNFTKELIIPKQDMRWEFGIDTRPFNNTLGLLPYYEFKTDTITDEIQYLKYNLMEEGDGLQFVKKINK